MACAVALLTYQLVNLGINLYYILRIKIIKPVYSR